MCLCHTKTSSGITITYDSARMPVTQKLRDLIGGQPLKEADTVKPLKTIRPMPIERPTAGIVYSCGKSFNDLEGSLQRDSSHRTNGKGGWIARNLGRKPEYKDRRKRAAGSGKTRAKNASL